MRGIVLLFLEFGIRRGSCLKGIFRLHHRGRSHAPGAAASAAVRQRAGAWAWPCADGTRRRSATRYGLRAWSGAVDRSGGNGNRLPVAAGRESAWNPNGIPSPSPGLRRHAATPGKQPHPTRPTPTGLCPKAVGWSPSPVDGGKSPPIRTQPRWGWGNCGVRRPKVAPRASGQPWAPGRNRVAVERATPRVLRRGVGCWLWVIGYEEMRSVRRVPMLPGRRLQPPCASAQAHGIPTGFRPPARGCGGTPLPPENRPTPPAQPQRGCAPRRWDGHQVRSMGENHRPSGHNPVGVGAIAVSAVSR